MPCQRLAGKANFSAFQAGGFTIFNIYPVESRVAGAVFDSIQQGETSPITRYPLSLVILFIDKHISYF
jgi:hypothetical protein